MLKPISVIQVFRIDYLLFETLRRLIENYKDDGKFIVGVVDQVPPDGDVNRVKRVSQFIECWCRDA